MSCFLLMTASAKIIDLRKLLTERFPHVAVTTPTRLFTSLSFLDEQISGGLPKGAITELISPQVSAGSASLIHALIQPQWGVVVPVVPRPVALIDGRDSFDPQPLGNACLRHLLWVRCNKAFEAIKAADLLLRDSNFTLLIVDLVLNPPAELRKIPQTSWYRLQRLVEPTSAVSLLLT